MVVDASAIIAIIAEESDGPSLAARLAKADAVWMSAITIYETVVGLAKQDRSLDLAKKLVDMFIVNARVQIVPIDLAISLAAVEAYAAYGKGRHRAALNMGDCFVYACAKSLGAPLLFKGNDFGHTDISVA